MRERTTSKKKKVVNRFNVYLLEKEHHRAIWRREAVLPNIVFPVSIY